MLGRLLTLQGIDTVVVEARSQSHAIERVRAGVLEQGTVDLMHQVGLGDRLDRQGLRHEGIYLAFNGRRHRIDMAATNGRAITVYGQNEVVRDLIESRVAADLPLHQQIVHILAALGRIATHQRQVLRCEEHHPQRTDDIAALSTLIGDEPEVT